jgi:hypothetical protein
MSAVDNLKRALRDSDSDDPLQRLADVFQTLLADEALRSRVPLLALTNTVAVALADALENYINAQKPDA